MDVHDRLPTSGASEPLPGARTQLPVEVKPKEAQVKNLNPLQKAAGAFKIDFVKPLLGRGSLVLKKFENLIGRITTAINKQISHFFNVSNEQKSHVEIIENKVGDAKDNEKPLEEQLKDVQQQLSELRNKLGMLVKGAGVPRDFNVRDALSIVDYNINKLEEKEKGILNELKSDLSSPEVMKKNLLQLENQHEQLLNRRIKIREKIIEARQEQAEILARPGLQSTEQENKYVEINGIVSSLEGNYADVSKEIESIKSKIVEIQQNLPPKEQE